MIDFNVLGVEGLLPIAQIGDNFMTQGIGMPLRPVSTGAAASAGIVSIRDFGATMDGNDDGPAIQTSLDTVGYAFVPKGIATILTPVIQPSDTVIFGVGMGVSTIQPHPTLPLNARMISNLGPSGGNRRTKNLTIRDLTLDGGTRTWPVWPASGYNTLGYLVYFAAVERYNFSRVEVKNHQSIAVGDAGGLEGTITDCFVHDNGNRYTFTPAVWISSSGNTYSILNITNTNPAVITLRSNGNLSASTTSMRINGVRSMNIPDATYPCVNVGANTFELTGLDATAMSTFVPDLMAYVGVSGNVGTAFVPSQNVTISGNHFNNNAFHHCSFIPTEGGNFINNRLIKCGESCIFAENTRNVVIMGNSFEDSEVVSIVANGVELNRSANCVVSGNYFSDTGTTPMSMNNGQNISIIGNTFNRSIKDNQVVYPPSPVNPSGGGLVGKNSVIKVGGVETLPGAGIVVSGNTVMDLRSTPQATCVVEFTKSGGSENVYDVIIKDNVWAQSGVPVADMVKINSSDILVPPKVRIAGNVGHPSAAPVVMQLNAPVSTGIVKYNIGFLPSCIHVLAYRPGTGVRQHTFVVCDPAAATPGSQGWGFAASDDTTANSLSNIAQKFYQLINPAGGLTAAANFDSWYADTTGIGFSINFTNVSVTASLTLLVMP